MVRPVVAGARQVLAVLRDRVEERARGVLRKHVFAGCGSRHVPEQGCADPGDEVEPRHRRPAALAQAVVLDPVDGEPPRAQERAPVAFSIGLNQHLHPAPGVQLLLELAARAMVLKPVRPALQASVVPGEDEAAAPRPPDVAFRVIAVRLEHRLGAGLRAQRPDQRIRCRVRRRHAQPLPGDDGDQRGEGDGDPPQRSALRHRHQL
jgi:hypothetical protein